MGMSQSFLIICLWEERTISFLEKNFTNSIQESQAISSQDTSKSREKLSDISKTSFTQLVANLLLPSERKLLLKLCLIILKMSHLILNQVHELRSLTKRMHYSKTCLKLYYVKITRITICLEIMRKPKLRRKTVMNFYSQWTSFRKNLSKINNSINFLLVQNQKQI